MEKKLYRIRNGSMLAGVCTGIAAYFNVDVNIVRLGAVILACMGGVGIIPYIVATIILPEGQ